MPEVLQLLQNYYKSVLESERIYRENTSVIPSNSDSSRTTAPKIVNETLLLQRQLSALTTQLQGLKRQNETLMESQKTLRALNESKIAKYKKIIDAMKAQQLDQSDSDNNDPDAKSDRFDYHLLSPVVKRGLKRGLRISNGNSNNDEKPVTIFDTKKKNAGSLSDDSLSADDSGDDMADSFVKSLSIPKDKTKTNKKSIITKIKNLNDLSIPSLNDFSKDEDDEDEDDEDEDSENNSSSSNESILDPKQVQKKRKLAKKRIAKFSTDLSDSGNDSMAFNKDSMDRDSLVI